MTSMTNTNVTVQVPDSQAIPAELTSRDQCIGWKRELRGDTVAKVPVDVTTGRRINHLDPANWRSFDAVHAVISTGGADGAGFVLTRNDPYFCIDLDHCRDPETGEIDPAAQEVLDRFDTYAEVSVSGTGVHILGIGTLPDGARNRTGNVEVYDRARFIAVTGNRLGDRPMADCGDELTRWHSETFGQQRLARERTERRSQPLTDDQLFEVMARARNVDKIRALWNGDTSGYVSQSEADLALVSHLAFYTQDEQQLDRLFQRSGLYREKWNQSHGVGTYGERTIDAALDGLSSVWTGVAAHVAAGGEVFRLDDEMRAGRPGLRLYTIDEIMDMPEPEWTVNGWLQHDTLVALYSAPGVGKTHTALDFSMCIASGTPWHGCRTEQGTVVYIAAEGAAGLRRRFRAYMAHHAMERPERLVVLPAPVNFRETDAVDQFIAQLNDLPESPQLVVIDTMAWAMAGGDENSVKDVMLVLSNARRIKERFGCTVLVIHHTGKNGEEERGSSALRGACDTMLKLAKSGEILTLSVDKQKDGPKAEDKHFRLEVVTGGSADSTSEDHFVLDAGDDGVVLTEVGGEHVLTEQGLTAPQRKLLTLLADTFDEEGATSAQLKRTSALSESYFYDVLKSIRENGFIIKHGTNQGARYTITEAGKAALGGWMPQPFALGNHSGHPFGD